MRVIFIGASQFGFRCLRLIHSLNHCEVVGVVSAPEVFSISYRPEGVKNILHANLQFYCEEQGIEMAMIHANHGMKDDALFEKVCSWEPDAYIVAGWYHLIPSKWRDVAPAYGLHASLLPDYSGGAPLVWAIINGEEKTGITLFQMDAGVDSGPIVGQAIEPILFDDTIASLYSRIEDRGIELLANCLPDLAVGKLELKLQDETCRRIVPQRSPEDGEIDWKMKAGYIDRFIRAQTKPYPGAFSRFAGNQLSIWKAILVKESLFIPVGQVRCIDDNYLVGSKEGAIQLLDVTYLDQNYSKQELSTLFNHGGQLLG
jgi:methionyl-tRNA formyltransferase